MTQKKDKRNSIRSLKRAATAAAILLVCTALWSCYYDEDIDLHTVRVRLVYPENSISPYAGARVEMKDSKASIFVDSTDATGTATFQLLPGIYEASTNSQYLDTMGTTWWRYIFNGVKSQIIISPDSTNKVDLTLKMSKKRIVH